MNDLSKRSAAEWLELDGRFVWHPFTQTFGADDPLLIESASGAVLKTEQGQEILDCISSWWVNLFGHGHPQVAAAIHEQAKKLEHVLFAGFTHQPAIQLAERLAMLLPESLNRVFFSDNGSTSVEVALKVAAQHWQNIQQPRQRILAFEGGYHGDTFGAMAAGRGSGFFDTWNSWLMNVDLIPYPETWMDDPTVEEKEQATLDALSVYLDKHGRDTLAMIMEPLVQGASGMRMCRPEFVTKLVRLLREFDILIIFDEVMTGFGRTGQNFAFQATDIQPDIICLSKGLTAGFLPMAVTVIDQRIYGSFQFDSPQAMFCHGHSYTANPLGCAAALASMDLLQKAETSDNWRRIQTAHLQGLDQASQISGATKRRNCGTIAAVDLATDQGKYHGELAKTLKAWFREENELVNGVLIRPLGNVIYLMPPYCMTDQQLETAWQAVHLTIERHSTKV